MGVALWELWDDLHTRLATVRMVSLLGTAGRVLLPYLPTPERPPEGTVWGHVFIVPTATTWRSEIVGGQPQPVGFLVRAEVPQLTDANFNPARLLDAIHREVAEQLNQYAPGGPFRHLMVARAIYQRTPPQGAPLLDSTRGVFYTSCEYRLEVVHSTGVP